MAIRISPMRATLTAAQTGLPTVYRCPGEPYTITEFICRRRQEKHYEKCPECPIHLSQPQRPPPPSLFHFKAKVQTIVKAPAE